jgi:hypothetical protein
LPTGLKLHIVRSGLEVITGKRINHAVDEFHLICLTNGPERAPLLVDGRDHCSVLPVDAIAIAAH